MKQQQSDSVPAAGSDYWTIIAQLINWRKSLNLSEVAVNFSFWPVEWAQVNVDGKFQ